MLSEAQLNGTSPTLDPSRTNAKGQPIFLAFRRFRKSVYWRLIVDKEKMWREGDASRKRSPRMVGTSSSRTNWDWTPRPMRNRRSPSRHNIRREGFFGIPQVAMEMPDLAHRISSLEEHEGWIRSAVLPVGSGSSSRRRLPPYLKVPTPTYYMPAICKNYPLRDQRPLHNHWEADHWIIDRLLALGARSSHALRFALSHPPVPEPPAAMPTCLLQRCGLVWVRALPPLSVLVHTRLNETSPGSSYTPCRAHHLLAITSCSLPDRARPRYTPYCAPVCDYFSYRARVLASPKLRHLGDTSRLTLSRVRHHGWFPDRKIVNPRKSLSTRGRTRQPWQSRMHWPWRQPRRVPIQVNREDPLPLHFSLREDLMCQPSRVPRYDPNRFPFHYWGWCLHAPSPTSSRWLSTTPRPTRHLALQVSFDPSF